MYWRMSLNTLRRKKGVSLEEISRTTKIRVCYLEAIEEGAFGALPGGIYSTSYIRQYAQAIDAGEGEILDRYYEATGAYPEPAAPPPSSGGGKGLLAEFLRPLTKVFS